MYSVPSVIKEQIALERRQRAASDTSLLIQHGHKLKALGAHGKERELESSQKAGFMN